MPECDHRHSGCRATCAIFLGDAKYTLHKVVPRAGGVDIWVNIEWSSDIRIYVDYLVINP